MKTVKKLLTLGIVGLFTTVFLLATGCSNSPHKPEWVEAGAERDTTRGMVRNFGLGTGPDKDTALFNARQNAIQAVQQECAGISLKKTVPRKTWVEPVMDLKDDEKIDHYQAHAVVEVSEDDCEKAQTPGKSMAAEMGENQRVSDQQDTYERILKKREGLPDDYYLKERAIAAQYATRDDVNSMLNREKQERDEQNRELHNQMEDALGHRVYGKTDGDMEGDETLEDTPEKDARSKCSAQLRQVSGELAGIVENHSMDRSAPAATPMYELREKMSRRCNALYTGKTKGVTWNFESEFNAAVGRSKDIDGGLIAQEQNLGHSTIAQDPRPYVGDAVRPDGLPNTSLKAPVSPAAPQAPAVKPEPAIQEQEVTDRVLEKGQEQAQFPQAVKGQAQRNPSSLAAHQ